MLRKSKEHHLPRLHPETEQEKGEDENVDNCDFEDSTVDAREKEGFLTKNHQGEEISFQDKSKKLERRTNLKFLLAIITIVGLTIALSLSTKTHKTENTTAYNPMLNASLRPDEEKTATDMSSKPISTSVTSRKTNEYPSFEVIDQIGGNLGGGAERLGVYQFDKMWNEAPAYTNGKYYVYYNGDVEGWQWNECAYNCWAGNGPRLNEKPDAQSYIRSSLFQLATDPTQQHPSFEVTDQIGGNLGGGAERLGVYQFDKMWNEAPAYTNGKYYVYYNGDDEGWQWNECAYNCWAGNGPSLNEKPDAQSYIKSRQFQTVSPSHTTMVG